MVEVGAALIGVVALRWLFKRQRTRRFERAEAERNQRWAEDFFRRYGRPDA